MKYADFEKTMSSQRMERYLIACGGNTRKSMTLYRYNLQVSQEMFTIVSCFEVAAIQHLFSPKVTGGDGIWHLEIHVLPYSISCHWTQSAFHFPKQATFIKGNAI